MPVFNGARVDRALDVRLGPGARMLWRELLALGRSGERGGAVRSTTRVEHDGRELFVEDLDLRDPAGRTLPGLLGEARFVGSVGAFGYTPPTADGPRGRAHPYRTALPGPGALLRVLGMAAPRLQADLDAAWHCRRGGPERDR